MRDLLFGISMHDRLKAGDKGRSEVTLFQQLLYTLVKRDRPLSEKLKKRIKIVDMALDRRPADSPRHDAGD